MPVLTTDPVHFLLVDDQEEILHLLEAMLCREGLVLLKARSGPEAMKLVAKHEFALALLDVRMPGMDGFELAELMRANESAQRVPIIFLTGDTDRQRRFRGYETGAVDFLLKPIDMEILRSKASVFFDLCRQRQQLASQHNELKAYAEILMEAKVEAERANAAKSDFLAMMSHEIRTPLHSVIGFSSLMQTTELSSEQREIIDGIELSSKHLLALVSDVLDLSRIESGRLALENRSVDLHSHFAKICLNTELEARQKGLRFRGVWDPSLPSHAVTDSLRIAQILGNLLANALKFTAEGFVELQAQAGAVSASGDCEVIFTVTDSGIGLSLSQQARLFQPFAQADSSLSRRYGGTGLGLVIVRRLCELMGGGISLESAEGVGSKFTAKIVVRAEESFGNAPRLSLSPESPPLQLPGEIKVLVAEDNPINQKLMNRLLAKFGCDVTIAGNGRECIEAYESGLFDLIFMDVSMPEMDGLQATQIIRAIEDQKKGNHLPIIALTAGVTQDQRRKCLEAGMNFFLGKPFTREGLSRVLLEVFADSPRAAREEALLPEHLGDNEYYNGASNSSAKEKIEK